MFKIHGHLHHFRNDCRKLAGGEGQKYWGYQGTLNMKANLATSNRKLP